ncbi:MAG: hypothetical protein AMS25_06460 [Gemmatimonas sp. SM23_52]|nr:MAG: hypothetical protein AMS25_06460 [Gemmatimonas sp. SM23_52]
MPLTVRRVLYSLLAALGFIMMVPLMANMRRFQAALAMDPIAVESALGAGAPGWVLRLTGLFLLGLLLATGFLYAALSAGVPRAWRPQENGVSRCRRCDAEIRFGIGRCPVCDQQLVW